MALAGSDNESMSTTSGFNTKRLRESTFEASDSLLASATEVTATAKTTSAGAGGKVASTSGVPSVTKSTIKSYTAEVGVLDAVISIDSVGNGRGGSADKALSIVGSAGRIETNVDVRTPAESARSMLGRDNILSVSDAVAAAAAAAIMTVTVTVTMTVTVAAATYKSAISGMARANESNIFTAENYYLLNWLYRIRRVSCARGLLIWFFRPDFLWSIYRPMMRSKKLWRTDGDIRVAADQWCFDRAAAEERYGHISDWDMSSVTNMSELFQGEDENERMEDRRRGKDLFNDDISRWDVSSVTNMSLVFHNAHAFNQPIGDWDVSNVTNMEIMFCDARSFNQAIGVWDVSNVTDMELMFAGAHDFNQPLAEWNVSKVTNMAMMFCDVRSFNQPIGGWNVTNVTTMDGMFNGTVEFNQDITRWDHEGIRYYSIEIDGIKFDNGMFENAQSMQRVNMPFAVREGLATAVAPPL